MLMDFFLYFAQPIKWIFITIMILLVTIIILESDIELADSIVNFLDIVKAMAILSLVVFIILII